VFIEIEPSKSLTLTTGDFGTIMSPDRTLQMPQKLHDLLRPMNLRSAEQFLSLAHSFPSAIAILLHWSPELALAAAAKLEAQLRPYIGERPTRRREFVWGVLPPSMRQPAPVVQPPTKKSRWDWLCFWRFLC
jgi:hypothetical protein